MIEVICVMYVVGFVILTFYTACALFDKSDEKCE